MKKLTEDQAFCIYDILMATCGAMDHWRENFVYHMTRDCQEFRFGGDLGSGGKLYNNSNGVYVAYYTEDTTPEREAMQTLANQRLKTLLT